MHSCHHATKRADIRHGAAQGVGNHATGLQQQNQHVTLTMEHRTLTGVRPSDVGC